MTTTLGLLERKKRFLMPCLYNFFGDDPLEPVRGEGVHVWDSAGRRYVDCYSGVGVTGLGHCHPEVTSAVIEQLGTLQHTTTIHLTEPMLALAERLAGAAPGALSRVYFCADGSGANEGAMVAARRATGRPNFLAFGRGLHGRTSLTMAVTGLGMWRADPFLPPVAHRVPHRAQGTEEQFRQDMLSAIASAPPNSIAAFIAEPVLGNGGMLPAAPGYFQAVAPILKEHGILLIVDEVQTGFCRTGAWFGIEHWGVQPDLMTVAKALGNGFPVAAWLATEEVAMSFTAPSASTFGGNLPAMAAGLKVMEIMERDGLAGAAARKGRLFLDALRAALNGAEGVQDIRGLGLMVGIELESAGHCDRALRALRDAGVLAGKTGPGRNVLSFEPPLIIEDELLLEVARKTQAAITGELA